MKSLSYLTGIILMLSALCSGIHSYRSTAANINDDINNALELTLAEMPSDVLSADTIRCYRNNLALSELKDIACIAMRTVCRDGKQETIMVAEANCDFMTIFTLSDQRASSFLLFIGLLWIIGSWIYMRRFRPELLMQGIRYGNIIYANGEFSTKYGQSIYLTPMQHSLLEMFMRSDNHTLTKQEICDHLWPNKPDASDTLYTLIKRIKPIIESNSNLKVESDRGRSYKLEIK